MSIGVILATGGLIMIRELLESSLDLLDSISLDNVADLDVVVALDVQTAVHTHVNFLDIVLESLEGSELSCIDYDTVADHAHLRCPL